MSVELDVPGLPEGVRSISIKEQKVFDGLPFPLILSPTESFKDKDPEFWTDWAKKNIKTIEDLLLKYSAILYRGFSFDDQNDFDEFAKSYGYDPFIDMAGIGVRKNILGNVYTSNETVPEFRIPFHHEMGHLSRFPTVLFLFCDIPAAEGGNTPIALSNVVYRKMAEREPDFTKRLEREGQRYMRVAPNGDKPGVSYGRSWQSTFFTTDREEAERKAKATGYDFEWLENGDMKTFTEVLPAIRVDRRTGKTMWFNSVFSYAMSMREMGVYGNIGVTFPNGDCINDEEYETLKGVMDEVHVSFKWQHSDLIMIDNRAVQHCKEPYVAPPRRILVSYFKDQYGSI